MANLTYRPSLDLSILTPDQWVRFEFCRPAAQTPPSPAGMMPSSSSANVYAPASPDGTVHRPFHRPHVLQAHWMDYIDTISGNFEAIKGRSQAGDANSARTLIERALKDPQAFDVLKSWIETLPEKAPEREALQAVFQKELMAKNNKVFLTSMKLLNTFQTMCVEFVFDAFIHAINKGKGHEDAESVLIEKAPFYPRIMTFLVARATFIAWPVANRAELIQSLLELRGLDYYRQVEKSQDDPIVKFFTEHKHPEFVLAKGRASSTKPREPWLRVVRNDEDAPAPAKARERPLEIKRAPSITKAVLLDAMKSQDVEQILSALNRLNDYLTNAGELGEFNRKKESKGHDDTTYERLRARLIEFVHDEWSSVDPESPLAVGGAATVGCPQIEIVLGDGNSKLTLYIIVGVPFKCQAKLVSPHAEIRSRWESITKVVSLKR